MPSVTTIAIATWPILLRVEAGLGELSEAAQSQDIVVMTHVSPIKAAVTWALGVGDEVVATTKITSLDPEKGRAVLACACAVNGKTVLDGEAVMMVSRRSKPA